MASTRTLGWSFSSQEVDELDFRGCWRAWGLGCGGLWLTLAVVGLLLDVFDAGQ